MKITTDEALDILEVLEVLGCGEDPIEINGCETCARDLKYVNDLGISTSGRLSRKRIVFWTSGARRITGTLADMLRDRMGIKK